MGWIGCVHCKKFRRDFVAQTFALARPFCTEFRKATKWYKRRKNVSLGSNGVDRVCLLQKIPTRLRGTNFCTTSARFAPSFVRQPNGPECTQIVRNAPKCQFMIQWGGLSAFVAKNYDATSWHELLHYLGPFCTEFRKATKRSEMHPNSTKSTKTSIYGAMGRIGCVRCEKFRSDFVSQTFALARPVLHRVS